MATNGEMREQIGNWIYFCNLTSPNGCLKCNIFKECHENAKAILTALDGPSEEERKSMCGFLDRVSAVLYYMAKDLDEVGQLSDIITNIKKFILGHAQEGEKKNGTR